MLGMRTCLPCHIPDRWSRNANLIWPDLAFGFVHKRSGNEINPCSVHTTSAILDLCLRKTRAGKSHDYRDVIGQISSFSKCFPSTRKPKAVVFKFLRFKKRFRKVPFSWRINVDGRPYWRNKDVFLYSFGVVWTGPKGTVLALWPNLRCLQQWWYILRMRYKTAFKWKGNFLVCVSRFPNWSHLQLDNCRKKSRLSFSWWIIRRHSFNILFIHSVLSRSFFSEIYLNRTSTCLLSSFSNYFVWKMFCFRAQYTCAMKIWCFYCWWRKLKELRLFDRNLNVSKSNNIVTRCLDRTSKQAIDHFQLRTASFSKRVLVSILSQHACKTSAHAQGLYFQNSGCECELHNKNAFFWAKIELF